MISTTFTFAACRNLKRFVGRATAAVAANEVALLHTTQYLGTRTEKDQWAALAQDFHIRVDGINTAEVRSTSARLHVLSIYAGFDRFVVALRGEWFELSGKNWRKHDQDGPIDEIVRNAPSKEIFQRHVDDQSVACLNHYRYVRNAVAHPSDDYQQSSRNHYTSQEAALRIVGARYTMTTAPHDLDHIDFHDAKLLSQLVLDLARQISNAFDPGDSVLAAAVPAKLRSRAYGNEVRRCNRIGCYLRTKYGLSADRADKIARDVLAS
jgi:hypothetical protein